MFGWSKKIFTTWLKKIFTTLFIEGNGTISVRVVKWIIGSATGLIAIPIAFLAILVSLYTDLFKDNVSEDNKRVRLETYYDLFDTQQQISNDSLDISKDNNKRYSNISVVENKTPYTHILVIDRTGSTNDNELDNQLTEFYQRVKISYLPNINIHNINKKFAKGKNLPIKHLIVLRYYQELIDEVGGGINPNNSKKILIAYFDGDSKNPNIPVTYPLDPIMPNVNINANNHIFEQTNNQSSVMNFVNKITTDTLFLRGNHTSDFNALFDEIGNLCKANASDSIILTIVSDFYHDKDISKNVSEKKIEDFKKNTQNVFQYNIIYCPSSNLEHKIKSDELINLLQKHTKGVNNLISIDLTDYQRLEDALMDMFDKKIANCFSPININNQNIKFFYPKYNSQGVLTAKAEVRLKNNTKGYSWRIATPVYRKNDDCDFIVSYSVNDNTRFKTTFALNRHYNQQQATDSILFLDIRYNSQLEENEYRLEIMQDGNKNFVAFPIHLYEYMPKIVAEYGIGLLNILCILIILIEIACLILLLRFVYTNKTKLTDKKRFWIIFIELILFLVGYGIMLYITWGKYCWLIVTSVVTVFCILLSIWLIRLLWKKKS
jgi:hypothetical protein